MSAEGILALDPSIVIGTEDMGPAATLRQLQDAGVEVAVIPLNFSVDCIKQQIAEIAEILDKEQEGKKLWTRTKASLDSVAAMTSKYQAKNKGKNVSVLFVLAFGGRVPSVAGRGTAASTMIELAGAYNPAAQQFKGYKVLSNEAIILLAPDVIVFPGSTSNYDMTAASLVEQLPVLKEVPAGRNGRIVSIDGTLLLGALGPRIADLVLSLANSFYTSQKVKDVYQ